ncbi:MAG: hypothetical protein HN769_14355 [Anaerolineae bacterium]|jgi:hypothetical protein|nr:hypothetical protein [Anaerolineae bacterium]
MAKYKRKIIAVRGDTHSGNAGGLVNPTTEIPEIDLDESGRRVIAGYRNPELRPVQKRIWRWHEEARREIKKLAGKDEISLLDLGDLTQGNIFRDDLAEASMNAQVILSRSTLLPWLEMKNLKKLRMTKGTGVHVWGEGSTETLLSAWLQDEYHKKDIKISDHWLLDVDGYKIDAAHHGPGPGTRNWTHGNAFSLYLKSELRNALDRSETPPNMVLRGHTHVFTYGFARHQIDATIYKTEGYITPPMCFIGSHARKVTRSTARMSIGMLALEIVDGKLLAMHPFLNNIDLRTEEIL